MQIRNVEIKNFRILLDVNLSLEVETTVIVGRNNSGKTCLTELFRRLLSDPVPKFSLEDFSLSSHEQFWKALLEKEAGNQEMYIRRLLPVIEAKLVFEYDRNNPNLGPLGEFVIDLDPVSTRAIASIKYELKDGGIDEFFKELKCLVEKDEKKTKRLFFREIKERITKYYVTTLEAIDPTDDTNRKALELPQLRALLMSGFIYAQRGLDDTTQKEKDILGKILQRLLGAASANEASASDKATVDALKTAVQGIQDRLDGDFTQEVNKLLPTLSLFGYPGLGDPNIETETTLDVERLLGDNTKIRYVASEGMSLPETYNGLGSRNLIYILFQLLEFFKTYNSIPTAPGIHLVFIEEPEAHLHPQMQEVFIRKIREIASQFEKTFNEGKRWPVQFVITTHSTHIANESSFESIRYFFSSKKDGVGETTIKDLRHGLKGETWTKNKVFLHKYLTLTKCDLFFADKAILIEGATERLLMPKMIEKIDPTIAEGHKLSSQYLTVMEVGGAYAHIFFELLDFLQLRTLIITDIDSVDSAGGSKSRVGKGTHTSNSCIKTWFADPAISPMTLMGKFGEDKIKKTRRLAYQIPEKGSTACGRSFEDAFMLANQALFEIGGANDDEKENAAWEEAKKVDKTNFALKYAIEDTTWTTPIYISEGLQWLAQNPAAVEEFAIGAAPAKKVPAIRAPKKD